jgi:hypothetical protein
MNYRQKHELGLFDNIMPDKIVISRDPSTVKGVVVACGYSKMAEVNIQALELAKRKNGWQFEIKQMPKMLLH